MNKKPLETKTEAEIEEKLVRSLLDVIVLFELKKSPYLSGYDMLEILRKRFAMHLSAGTVYSVLYMMERKGLLKGEHQETRRAYTLTEEGQKTINAVVGSKEELQRFFGNLVSE